MDEAKEDKIKQVIVIRKDLKMGRGKAVSQGAHSSLAAAVDGLFVRIEFGKPYIMIPMKKGDPLEEWLVKEKFTKIVVVVNSEEELKAIYDQAVTNGVRASYIIDSGLTEFHGIPTATSACIGPDYSSKLDPITGHLPLFN